MKISGGVSLEMSAAPCFLPIDPAKDDDPTSKILVLGAVAAALFAEKAVSVCVAKAEAERWSSDLRLSVSLSVLEAHLASKLAG